MSIGIHFGIDTSNYTTSAAAITSAGEVFCAKRPLSVSSGDRGLRQSDALFCHIKNLDGVMKECLNKVKEVYPEPHILSVGVSDQPRRVEGSYMPCFLAGVSAASAAAELCGVPLFRFSHQEGHIAAALLGARELGNPLEADSFLAFHLSGGTTELLQVEKDGGRFRATLLATSLDLTLGQLIDRCGVYLGLPFPAGAHLEKLALLSEKTYKIRIPVREGGINLSGFENQFLKRRDAGERREDLAKFIFDVALAAVHALLSVAGGDEPVLFSGGVSSSAILKAALSSPRFHFAPPHFSADNAIGIAYLSGKGDFDGSHTSHDRNGSE